MSTILTALLEKGSLGLCISLVEYFVLSLSVYFCMYKLLPNRLNIYGLVALSLVYTLWSNLRLPVLYGTPYHFWMTVFINVWTPFVLLCFYQGPFWRRVIVYWYFDIIKAICEAIAFVPIMLYQAYGGYHSGWAEVVSALDTAPLLRLLYVLVFLPLFILFGFLSLNIWRRLLLERFQPFYLLFISLPLGQMYALSLVIRPNMGNPLFGVALSFTPDVEALYYILSLLGVFICLFADIVILNFVLSHRKGAAMEAELREAKRLMELEQSHYREVEQSRDELAKIRHDFNNQLASIIQLVQSGEDGPAQELIDSLGKEINKAY